VARNSSIERTSSSTLRLIPASLGPFPCTLTCRVPVVAARSSWCYRRPDPNNTRSIALSVALNRARLQSERRKRGWSQDDLAAASGISTRTVQRLERGGKATVSSLAALASTLAISAGELTASVAPVRRITPLTILTDIAPTLERFLRMGFGVLETEHPGCMGVVPAAAISFCALELS
jgi:transcriptional regulator with XRE-family HTH domain